MRAPSKIGVGHVGVHDMVQGCAKTPNKVRFTPIVAIDGSVPKSHKFGHAKHAEIDGKYAEIGGTYSEIGGKCKEIGGKAKTCF